MEAFGSLDIGLSIAPAGNARTWGDAASGIAALVFGGATQTHADVLFARLSRLSEEGAGAPGTPYPPRIMQAARALEILHGELWQLRQQGRSEFALSVLVALVEDDRTFVLQVGPGSAFQVGDGGVQAVASPQTSGPPLGAEVKSGIAVHAPRFEPGDRLVLMAGAPDSLSPALLAHLCREEADAQTAAESLRRQLYDRAEAESAVLTLKAPRPVAEQPSAVPDSGLVTHAHPMSGDSERGGSVTGVPGRQSGQMASPFVSGTPHPSGQMVSPYADPPPSSQVAGAAPGAADRAGSGGSAGQTGFDFQNEVLGELSSFLAHLDDPAAADSPPAPAPRSPVTRTDPDAAVEPAGTSASAPAAGARSSPESDRGPVEATPDATREGDAPPASSMPLVDVATAGATDTGSGSLGSAGTDEVDAWAADGAEGDARTPEAEEAWSAEADAWSAEAGKADAWSADGDPSGDSGGGAADAVASDARASGPGTTELGGDDDPIADGDPGSPMESEAVAAAAPSPEAPGEERAKPEGGGRSRARTSYGLAALTLLLVAIPIAFIVLDLPLPWASWGGAATGGGRHERVESSSDARGPATGDLPSPAPGGAESLDRYGTWGALDFLGGDASPEIPFDSTSMGRDGDGLLRDAGSIGDDGSPAIDPAGAEDPSSQSTSASGGMGVGDRASAPPPAGMGRLAVGARRFVGDGFDASRGDSVFVDRQFAGVTPIELTVAPGMHSVRVGADLATAITRIVDVPEGASRTVRADFGVEARLTLRPTSYLEVEAGQPLMMSVLVDEADHSKAERLTCHYRVPGGEAFQSRPMTRAQDGFPYWVASLPGSETATGTLEYYFAASDVDGAEIVSEIFEASFENPNPDARAVARN